MLSPLRDPANGRPRVGTAERTYQRGGKRVSAEVT